MPTRDAAPTGAPCWIDLFTNDVDAAHRFYGELFGWTIDVAEEFGGYGTFHLDGVPVAGCMGNSDPGHPADFWSVYLNTPDIAATFAAAQEAGRLGLQAHEALDRLAGAALGARFQKPPQQDQ